MKAIRICLCVFFAFSVFAHGVVEVWSESILEIGASALLVCWAILAFLDPKTAIRWSGLNWPFLGIILIGIFQLGFRGTVNPFLTRVELLRFGAYFIIFFLCQQVFRHRADLVKLVWFLIFLGFSVALLGIIQHFTSEGTIYWVRHIQQGDVFGPYVNRNHFAGFIELVVPLGFSMIVFRGLRRDLLPMAGLATILPVSALILSGSRGGIVSLAFEIIVLALLARTQEGPKGPTVIAIVFVGMAALVLIAWLGPGKALERFSTIRMGDVSLSRRASMFRGAEHIFLDHPVKGIGLGAIVTAFPRYETQYDGLVVNHVHNDYIEALAETGALGALCGAVFFGLLFDSALKALRADQGHFSRALHAGALSAVCGILIHSFVDFNLHIPSNAMLFLLQTYLATSDPLPSADHGLGRHRRHAHRGEQVLAEP